MGTATVGKRTHGRCLFSLLLGSSPGNGARTAAPDDAAATLMIQGKERQFDKRDSVRLSNSLGEELRAEVATRAQKARQETLFQLVAADSAGVGTDV